MNVKRILERIEKDHPRLLKLLIDLRRLLSPLDRYQAQRSFRQLSDQFRQNALADGIQNPARWTHAFASYLKQLPRRQAIYRSFATCRLKLYRRSIVELKTSPILICVVKNDLARIRLVCEHHRAIGIEQFVFLDNGSTDGTLEYLSEQPDTDVYQTLEPFESLKKYGWINHLLARYGDNRWYLYVDSDELFVYPGCEQNSINHLITRMQDRQWDRLPSLMLDMYSKHPIYHQQPVQDIRAEYAYFDSSSYKVLDSTRGLAIHGGPRKRVFAAEQELSPLLVKHPLFYLKPGMIFESAHYLYPYQKPETSKVYAALLHYKFLPADLERHREIAAKENFQGGSREYKSYLSQFEQNPSTTFLDDHSIMFDRSDSLLSIEWMEAL